MSAWSSFLKEFLENIQKWRFWFRHFLKKVKFWGLCQAYHLQNRIEILKNVNGSICAYKVFYLPILKRIPLNLSRINVYARIKIYQDLENWKWDFVSSLAKWKIYNKKHSVCFWFFFAYEHLRSDEAFLKSVIIFFIFLYIFIHIKC